MPIRKTDQGWYWGTRGPFPTKERAEQVERAAYASGYKKPKKPRKHNESISY